MITLDYLGVQGTGKTLKEAKADAARKVKAIVESSKSPRIWRYKGNTIIAWQVGENGGAYTMIQDGAEDGWRHGCSMPGGDLEDAFRKARAHLAHNLNDAEAADPRDRAEVERDNARNARFQAAYKVGISEGMDDSRAHHYACEAITGG